MLFQVYGDNAVFQWIGWAIVFVALILVNEFARRSKAGGIICGRMAILAEGDAKDRKDIIYLEPLPLFNADGTEK